MAGVEAEEVPLIAARGLMGVSYRQSKRIWRRDPDEGDAGLGPRLGGKPSARRKPAEWRERVLALCEEERYEGFGPTLRAEPLLTAKLVADHEPLRRWRIAKGQHPGRRRKQQPREGREPGAKGNRAARNNWRGKGRRRSLGELGAIRAVYPAADALCCQAGVSPVSFQSGKLAQARIRWACDGVLRHPVHLWADCRRKKSAWAQAYYQGKRPQGHDHASALRCLGKRWLKVLWRLWQDGQKYDATRHEQSLKAHDSWAQARLDAALQATPPPL